MGEQAVLEEIKADFDRGSMKIENIAWLISLAERVPKDRPETSQTVIDEFSKIIDAQDDKGLEKYGVSIDDANDEDYDWKMMALEETADLQKYLIKQIRRLVKEKQDLQMESQYLSLRLEKAIKENEHFRKSSRISSYIKIAEENLKLAQRNQELEAIIKSNRNPRYV